MNYYNEHDPFAAQWIRELMADGLIPEGVVDERSIADVQPADLKGYTQLHFFAGLAGWSLALRRAGWRDDEPVVTGSCPCQPFSAAGKRGGAKDERDLWPEFHRLIEACRWPVVLGEQVASSDVVGTELEAAFLVAVQAGECARANKIAKRLAASRSFHFHPRWLTRVRADMAASDYSLRWGVLGAHSVRSPNIRQRLFWVANAERPERWADGFADAAARGWEQEAIEPGRGGIACGLADANRQHGDGAGLGSSNVGREQQGEEGVRELNAARRVADADGGNAGDRGLQRSGQHGQRAEDDGTGERMEHPASNGWEERRPEPVGRGTASGCSDGSGLEHTTCGREDTAQQQGQRGGAIESGADGSIGLEHAESDGHRAPAIGGSDSEGEAGRGLGVAGGRCDSFWSDSILIPCRDGKLRRIPARHAEPGILGVVDGIPTGMDGGWVACGERYPLTQAKIEGRVGLLRGFGNAINPEIAAEFIKAIMRDARREA